MEQRLVDGIGLFLVLLNHSSSMPNVSTKGRQREPNSVLQKPGKCNKEKEKAGVISYKVNTIRQKKKSRQSTHIIHLHTVALIIYSVVNRLNIPFLYGCNNNK